MSKGYVYVLTNPAMPGLVKIGRTVGEPEERARQLSTTGVPLPFDVDYYVFCPDCEALEGAVHQVYDSKRLSEGREFFCVTPEEAATTLDTCLFEQVANWIEDFLPDYLIVHADEFVNISAFKGKIEHEEIWPPDIRLIIEDITAEEVQPAVQRAVAWKKKLQERRKEAAQTADTGEGF